MHNVTWHPFLPVTHPNVCKRSNNFFHLLSTRLDTESGCRRGFHDLYHLNRKSVNMKFGHSQYSPLGPRVEPNHGRRNEDSMLAYDRLKRTDGFSNSS
ncbi:hypothetical protein PISMIDRAFT_689430 [Pisolithus microcarpus 441]|uniref:Uncharacterized protein n=1 Tax=Pisolithus microcarpus 441 TaxID=765257 RepID=A0A0C9YX84_9AGAM|nr:hypothetical protein PISMIDRAFT_689430 [Pisolithus microcarpus 441]